jgi:hypothetical protein
MFIKSFEDTTLIVLIVAAVVSLAVGKTMNILPLCLEDIHVIINICPYVHTCAYIDFYFCLYELCMYIFVYIYIYICICLFIFTEDGVN